MEGHMRGTPAPLTKSTEQPSGQRSDGPAVSRGRVQSPGLHAPCPQAMLGSPQTLIQLRPQEGSGKVCANSLGDQEDPAQQLPLPGANHASTHPHHLV